MRKTLTWLSKVIKLFLSSFRLDQNKLERLPLTMSYNTFAEHYTKGVSIPSSIITIDKRSSLF
jgi:hypothetical protein